MTTELNSEMLMNIAGQIRGLSPETVCLAGGEPLLLPDFTRIVEVIDSPETELTVITSGTAPIPTGDWADHVTTIQLSTDSIDTGTNDRLRGLSGALDHAIMFANWASALELRKLRIACTASSLNLKGIPEFLTYWGNHPAVKSIVIQPLIALGRGVRVRRMQISADEALWLEEVACSSRVALGVPVTFVQDPFEQPRRNVKVGLDLVQFHVAANGDVHPHPLAPALLGSLASGEDTLAAVLDRSRRFWAESQHMEFPPPLLPDDSPPANMAMKEAVYQLAKGVECAEGELRVGARRYAMNEAAQFIISRLLEGPWLIDELSSALASEFDVPITRTQDDVRRMIATLTREGLIESPDNECLLLPQHDAPPCEGF